MSNALKIIERENPALAKLPPSKAQMILDVFVPMAELVAEFEGHYNELMFAAEDGVTLEISKRARRLRLEIAKVRVATDKARKETKAEYLLASQAIDGTAKILTWAISQKEEMLEEVEKFAERQAEEERQRLQAQRADEVHEYLIPGSGHGVYHEMTEDQWSAYVVGMKGLHEKRVEEALRLEKIAQEEREEQARIREENERLRAEAADAAKREVSARAEAEAREREAARALAAAKKEAEAKLAEEKREAEARLAEERRKAAEALAKEKLKRGVLEAYAEEMFAALRAFDGDYRPEAIDEARRLYGVISTKLQEAK